MAELIAEMSKEDDQLVPTLKITEALIVSEMRTAEGSVQEEQSPPAELALP